MLYLKNGNLEDVSLEKFVYDCPPKEVFEYIECTEKRLEKKKKEITAQAITELTEQEKEKRALEIIEEDEENMEEEEDEYIEGIDISKKVAEEDIPELLDFIERIADVVIKKYIKLKNKKEKENEY